MAYWTSLVVLSVVVVSTLSLPHHDEYKIPVVGTGQRSQYYVLHDDGSFKYGYDTGDGGFESQKTDVSGHVDGRFGYIDPEGQEINIQYTSGRGGFVAHGDHIPRVHPDVEAAFALARSAGPFVDPLAGMDGDRSYNFNFEGDEHSRSEVSDRDGTVRGSYSYVDEFGRTRTYTYRAGKGIGFVIEGDDIPQQVQPLVSHTTTTHFTGSRQQRPQTSRAQTRTSNRVTSSSFIAPRPARPTIRTGHTQSVVRPHSFNLRSDGSYDFSYEADDHSRSESSDSDLNVEGTFSFTADDGQRRTLNYAAGSGIGFQAQGAHLPIAPVDNNFGARHSSTRRSDSRRTSSTRQRTVSPRNQQTSQTYFPPTQTLNVATTRTASNVRTRHRAPTASNVQSTSFFARKPTTTHSTASTRISPSNQAFEAANIRSSFSPSGSYSLSYETSSHSRQESGDDDNNVRGRFTFEADDGVDRSISYVAGSATGFIAEGDHLPIGPPVPGAPTGQVTGRLVDVEEIHFVDPLADGDLDASYGFSFESETYSRSETADEDGNISGTYSILGDDDILRTYRFRAGKGIGYEIEETSAVHVPRRSQTSTTVAHSQASTTGHSTGFRAGQGVTRTVGSGSSRTSSHTHQRVGTQRVSGATVRSSQQAVSHSSRATATQPIHSSTSHGKFRSGTVGRTTSTLRSSSTPTQTNQVFPGFTLHQYSPQDNRGKYGYVLKFD